jgi:hypothetical protein
VHTDAIELKLDGGAVVGSEYVPNGATADQVADLLGHILGVISGSFQLLSHGDDVKALLAGLVRVRLEVPQEDEVSKAVEFAVGAEDGHGTIQVALAEGDIYVGRTSFRGAKP